MRARQIIRRAVQFVALLCVIFAGIIAWAFFQDWHSRVQLWLAENAWEGNVPRMRLCLALGASVNGGVSATGPALTSAAQAGRLDAIRFLLSHGADINIQCHKAGTPLMCASRHGHLEVVRFLLDGGADPNIISGGAEPGYTALDCARNRPDITALLLSRGAKPGKGH